MVKRHLENEPAKEARITAFMAEWGTAHGRSDRRTEALKVLSAELGFNDHKNVAKYYNQWLLADFKRGPFTDAERLLLAEGIEKFGTHWQRIQEDFLPERSTCDINRTCLLYTSPSPRDGLLSRMPSSA